MRSKRGRPSGRPTSRSSIVGHPGASPEKAGTAFPPPPGPPSSTTALGCGGLLTLTLRGKAMDGFEEQQERNRPQLSPPSLENRRNGCRFPTSANRPAALRRVPLPRSFSSLRTEHTIDRPQTLATQSTRPPNRGRSKRSSRCFMLFLFAKNEQGDLTPSQVRTLARLVREEFR